MREVFRTIERVAESRATRADHRRERHRQGARRARDPRPRPAQGRALRRGQLRRDPADADRERALRPREGRLHRRARATHRQVRGRHGGTLFLDEIGELAAVRAGEAAARAPGAQHRAARRDAADCRSTCACSPRPIATSSARSRRGASATISTTGSTSSRSSCRRCASAARTCSCSRSASSNARARRAVAARSASRPSALAALERYAWPGNVRELENAIERAVTLAEATRSRSPICPTSTQTRAAPSRCATRSARAELDLETRRRPLRAGADPRGARAHRREPDARGRAARTSRAGS